MQKNRLKDELILLVQKDLSRASRSFYNKVLYHVGTTWASLNLSENLDNEINLFTSLGHGFV